MNFYIKPKFFLIKIFQCNSNHEVFRKAGSKARQKKLVQKIEDDMEIDWNEVDPSDAVSILKVGKVHPFRCHFYNCDTYNMSHHIICDILYDVKCE